MRRAILTALCLLTGCAHNGVEEARLKSIEDACKATAAKQEELARRTDAIVTHDELIAQVWGPEYRGSNHYLHNYLGRLRKKMGVYGGLLETVPGMGYNLHAKLND